MNIVDFENVRDETEEILDYSGFQLNPARYGWTGHIWEIIDDDSNLNDDGGQYTAWLDLNDPNEVRAGTQDIFEDSQRDIRYEVFEVLEWRGWSGTVAEAIEWLARWGLDSGIAEDLVSDISSIDEDVNE